MGGIGGWVDALPAFDGRKIELGSDHDEPMMSFGHKLTERRAQQV